MPLAITVPNALSTAGLNGSAVDQAAEATRTTAGATIAELRAQGTASPFGDTTEQVTTALAHGFAGATRAALLVAAVFLLIGLVGALRVRMVARELR